MLFTKITHLENSLLYVEANGKLDIYSAYDYLDEIKEHLSRTYTKELILDFSGIISVASVGLRVILELYKMMHERNRCIKLKNVNEEVLSAFQMTGFDKFLTIENDLDVPTDNDSENVENEPAEEKIGTLPLCQVCGNHLLRVEIDNDEYANCPKCGHKSLKQKEIHVSAYID